MGNEYFLLFKTGQSEMRCWSQFENSHKNAITPIIELTRGRKKPSLKVSSEDLLTRKDVYNLDRNIDYILNNFKNNGTVILDITREQSLTCFELIQYSKSQNGYEDWVKFCRKIKEYGLDNLIPTLLINPDENEDENKYIENINQQYDSLMEAHGAIAYRASVLNDTEFLADILILKDKIIRDTSNDKRFILILDHEFIRSGTGILHAMRTNGLIKRIMEMIPSIEFVVLATSFPKSVTELGSEDKGTITLEEEYLYDEIIRLINDNKNIYYGDYGSINPIRNDIIARGWRPRIDFTTTNRRIFYYREKREAKKNYAEHYKSVAKSVIRDSRFDKSLGSWGVQQIENAANGNVPGSSPSFWISVRMEIFLQRQTTERFANSII